MKIIDFLQVAVYLGESITFEGEGGFRWSLEPSKSMKSGLGEDQKRAI